MNKQRLVALGWTGFLILAFIVLMVTLTYSTTLQGQHGPKPKPSPSPTSTATATPTPTPTPIPSPSPTVTPTPTPTVTPTPIPSPSPTAFLSLATANLSHGQGTDGQFNYDRQTEVLSSADIVSTQEASVGDLQNWDAGFSSRGFTRAVFFANYPGAGDGQAVWYKTSTVTVNAVYTHQLSNGFISWDGSTRVDNSAVALDVTTAIGQFIVVDVHLCPSRCFDSSTVTSTNGGYSVQREAQINELMSWINSTFPGQRTVLMGDMNMTTAYLRQPSGFQIDLILGQGFVDVWQQSIADGKAVADWGDRDGNGQPDMFVTALQTADKRRIDYFFSRGQFNVIETNMPDSRAQCPHALVLTGAFPECTPEVQKLWDITADMGWRVSDHNFLWLTLSN